MSNAYCKVRAELSGGGELTLTAMDEHQLLEVGRKVYECAKIIMQNPEYRKRIREEAARLQLEDDAKQGEINFK